MSRSPLDQRVYLLQSLDNFIKDPPDTEFRLGYLNALLVVWREMMGFDVNHPTYVRADYLTANIILEEGEAD